METINGIYTSAILHLTENPETNIDPYARSQIKMLCNTEALAGSRIRIMPDVHPGKVATIGFTATIQEKLMPLLIGIDIGCGMTIAHITKGRKEWQKLDSVIRNNIPSGSAIRKSPHALSRNFHYEELHCAKHIRPDKSSLSLGTLGSGNHFIEVDSDDNNIYIVIHSGSRHLGKEITDYYMSEGQKILAEKGIRVAYELTWLEDGLLDSYLHDLRIAQDYAELNRQIMLAEILKNMKWKADDTWSCPHNYIATDDDTLHLFGSPMLRKGAISAKTEERVIIPINMKEGIILGTGLGNKDWNCSAPHGAGRIFKRKEVQNRFTLSLFKAEMKGIYSSCIGKDTLDEAPFAYRKLRDILDAIGETVQIDKVLHPVYNFKAGNK